jgi:hypothetical protein
LRSAVGNVNRKKLEGKESKKIKRRLVTVGASTFASTESMETGNFPAKSLDPGAKSHRQKTRAGLVGPAFSWYLIKTTKFRVRSDFLNL